MMNPMESKASADAKVSAGALARPGFAESMKFKNRYRFECRDAEGKLKWTEDVENLVTTQGLNDALTQYFKGSGYTAAFFVGLVDNAGFSAFNAADTAAQIGGTNGWAESSAYSQSVRQTLTLGTASGGSIDNSSAVATFSINATVTLKGAFTDTNSTKGGTSGKIYSEAAFSVNRSLANGDTLTVTVTLTLA